jgi:hypothetical protein
LEKHGYRYAIIGGIAVSTWGRTRTTYDIDIKVLVPEADYSSVRGIIRSAFPERARPHIQENPLIVDTKVDNRNSPSFSKRMADEEEGIERVLFPLSPKIFF